MRGTGRSASRAVVFLTLFTQGQWGGKYSSPMDDWGCFLLYDSEIQRAMPCDTTQASFETVNPQGEYS